MTDRRQGGESSSSQDGGGSVRSEERAPGAKRKKLAGYLKAANDLRHSYQQSYTSGWTSREGSGQGVDDGTPGAFPEAAVVRSGDEEMILFPSYARKHIKRKPEAVPGTIQETEGQGRDVRDTVGAGDAEFWAKEWEKYEDDNAVVDVDVRGWIYTPHKGQMTRKHRLFIGIARQLVGLPAPSTPSPSKGSPSSSPSSSRASSPHTSHRERVEARSAQREEEIVSKEAESILRRGEAEAAAAGRGKYSEAPGTSSRDNSPLGLSRKVSPAERRGDAGSGNASDNDEPPITALQKRASWNQPSNMSPAELSIANSHLMARLKPFLSNPLANTPISAFFYNDKISRQRTTTTDASGHFTFRAALEFVPTHVRILASEKLSATEEIIITDPKGVSVISDIDDTIKHSAITSGAREIFRNAFIRELGDLTIEGVREWYCRLAELGVKFHYVSNSPWQIYPILTKFFSLAGLPAGSFHLKQYSGMFQGIFEPVAERKKGTLDKISRDFPERNFILIGDSGEADLEVYVDFVLENPGRVLGIFIRDVTTAVPRGFFDSSMGSLSGENSPNSNRKNASNGASASAKSMQHRQEEDDPDLKAAIAASLRSMEKENEGGIPEQRPNLPGRKPSSPPAPEAQSIEKLIDFSDDEPPSSLLNAPHLTRASSDPAQDMLDKHTSPARTNTARSMPPMPPRKPVALRSPSSEQTTTISTAVSQKGPRPPKPRRPSTSVHAPQAHNVTSTSNQSKHPKPDTPPKPALNRGAPSYASRAGQKLSSAYSHLPSVSGHWHSQEHPPTEGARAISTNAKSGPPPDKTAATDKPGKTDKSDKSPESPVKRAPPPPPPRRGLSSYPAAAAQYASNRVSGYWNGTSSSQQPYGSANRNGSQTSLASVASVASNNTGPAVSKRETLWRQRWARAEAILRDKGVVLRSWRVGSDAIEESVRLVEEAKRKWESEGGGVEGAEKRELEEQQRRGKGGGRIRQVREGE
ncbi:hypothetical protein H2201_004980 [Coniosporium apollinis]|uniref:Phosphatidate phosphatase APP1 catalytic domain-containing protein n=1 Tax=Coniosporium apollinis TaxID=61459 RepID=A0ABQ9NWD6_9PEZI|nr:hypothetical protein H2201_004980 [Coniosporium apollinis]